MHLRTLAAAGATVVAMGTAIAPAAAQTIDTIVPFSAGGGTDTVARVFAPAFGEEVGATTVIRNLAGASGTIGAGETASARPDGATLGYLPVGTVVIQPFLNETSYQPSDLVPICQTTSTPMFLMTRSDSDWSSVEDVIAAGQDGRLIYGSSGPGTIVHLAMAAFSLESGLDALHLPFEGTGPAMNAMAGGEIQLFADTATVLESNDVKPLAIFAEERSDAYPDVPTMAELGYEGLDFAVWQGLFGPTGLPDDMVQEFATACEAAVNSESFQAHLEQTNTGFAYRGPEEFGAFVDRSQEMNRALLEELGLSG